MEKNSMITSLKKDNNAFHVLTVGGGFDLIERLWNPLQAATCFAFSHILAPWLDKYAVANQTDTANFYCVRDDLRMKMPTPDMGYLAALEQRSVPTIHNMILSDRVMRTLDYTESLAYATYLGHRLEYLFKQINPSVIIGGFDGLHSGIALAIARKLNIPWFALNFTTIPTGLAGFCTGLTPDTSITVRSSSPEALHALAEQTLREFESQRSAVPAYLSANSVAMIIKRIPRHIKAFYNAFTQLVTMRFDKFTQYSVRRLTMEYIRKRRNMLFLPTHWFSETPPETPYLFIGLHMQPESSVDVWAPFYSNQFNVIEAISRSTPPSHQILVKLHKSDADNYSRRQLDHLRRLPGVRIVSPYAMSRMFIENASLVLAIQGNIALEAALLGRPVLVFGDTKFVDLPSVSRVNRITDLPAQIRNKLSEERPSREAIVRGLMSYLSYYAPGCFNDWEVTPSEAEIEALAEQFKALRDFVEEKGKCAE